MWIPRVISYQTCSLLQGECESATYFTWSFKGASNTFQVNWFSQETPAKPEEAEKPEAETKKEEESSKPESGGEKAEPDTREAPPPQSE